MNHRLSKAQQQLLLEIDRDTVRATDSRLILHYHTVTVEQNRTVQALYRRNLIIQADDWVSGGYVVTEEGRQVAQAVREELNKAAP